MDAADIDWLRSAEGSAAAAQATALLAHSSELSVLRRLGRTLTSSQARAAVSLALGRSVARAKFEDADRLFCDREAAQQASHESVSRHLAARFAGTDAVADLGCGMGGDALALAQHARVVSVDRDPARLAMLTANAAVRGLASNVTPAEADLLDWSPPAHIEAIWADPARRDTSGRRLEPEAWSPPLSRILELATDVGAAGIKLAPGIDTSMLPPDVEVEFVSLDRDMKAAVLWTGRLARNARTATILPAGRQLTAQPDGQQAEVQPPGRYLYDPDPTVGRAGLIDTLAIELGAWKLDERIAYLTSDVALESPFVRRFRVHSWFPFAERRLLGALREVGASHVEVTRRGSPVDTNALERRLNSALRSAAKPGPPTSVVLTRLGGEHIALVCSRDDASTSSGGRADARLSAE